MLVTEEMRIAERHRRYQLGSAQRRIENIRVLSEAYQVDSQNTATMRLALHSLMVGSHAYRGTPV